MAEWNLEILAQTVYCGDEDAGADWCNLPEATKDAWRSACVPLVREMDAAVDDAKTEIEIKFDSDKEELEDELERVKKTCREAAEKIRQFMEASADWLPQRNKTAKDGFVALRDEVINQLRAIEKVTEDP